MVESEEKDLIDIHFQQINKLLVVLHAQIEPVQEGEDGLSQSLNDKASENHSKSDKVRRVMLEIDKLLRRFVHLTGNIDNIIHIINDHGLDSPSPHLRFRSI